MTSSAALRQQFLAFFQSKQHEMVKSSPLVPGNDQTLLFTNAGMVQFKDVFLGIDQRRYTRATTSQRCVRAGGKHNDLENVGYTARHHTFFEMLGNFSFGDYFKEEAIHYAWEFLTEVVKLPPERLWITVFDEDDEAADIWLNTIGVNPKRLSRIGAKDNFWQMGDTGPCGPCTEIFYDHGEDIWGGPPGTAKEEGDRYIEIWNLVFMQYNRSKNGTLTPLPKPSVDTGMGLERLAAILQGVHNNYEIDLFQNLIQAITDLGGIQDKKHASLNVIADHIRSCSFLIVDGILPSNEGRGYVLRRIIRRAARHGHKLGLKDAFFYRLVAPLVIEMGDAYPELEQAQSHVERVLKQEELRFSETLGQGMKILEVAINQLSGDTLAGETVFKLYDTYGFPLDLTADIARERHLKIDRMGFDKAMEAQRQRARAAGQFNVDYDESLSLEGKTNFTGYEQLIGQSQVQTLLLANKTCDQLEKGDKGAITLLETPFYAESGGQIGDTGVLKTASSCFAVSDTKKQGNVFVHYGQVISGQFHRKDSVEAEVDAQRRQAIVLNHSATHLMQAALRQVLGEHVQQKGSLVTHERLRFDFSHFKAVNASELRQVETLVNQQIRANASATAEVMSMDNALNSGAMALFGEKYAEQVRVVSLGFSTELCGGVHVSRTGDIGLFKIISEGGVAAGIRRIEAVSGENALNWVDAQIERLESVAACVKSSPLDVDNKVSQLLQHHRTLEKELTQLKSKLANQAGSDLSSQAVNVAGIKVLAANLNDTDPKRLRETVDQLKNKLGKAVIVLAAVKGKKISLIAGVTKAESHYLKAGQLVNHVAQQVGGRGGGRPDMAQAGGSDVSALPKALTSVKRWVESKL